MEILIHSVLHALEDSVRMLPFLYLAYLLIEWLERHHGQKIERRPGRRRALGLCPRRAAGLCAPVRILRRGRQPVRQPGHYPRHGAGGVPGHLRRGHPPAGRRARIPGPPCWLVILLKVGYRHGLAGFVLDVPLRRFLPASLYGGYAGHAEDVDCHEEHEESSGIWLSALRHTLEIFAFILVFSFAITLVFELVGEDAVASGCLRGWGSSSPWWRRCWAWCPTAWPACC